MHLARTNNPYFACIFHCLLGAACARTVKKKLRAARDKEDLARGPAPAPSGDSAAAATAADNAPAAPTGNDAVSRDAGAVGESGTSADIGDRQPLSQMEEATAMLRQL